SIFGEQYAHNIADVKQPTLSLQHRWVIDGWWKLISPNSRTRPDSQLQLYDLKNDPWEKTNLAESNPAKVEALTVQLDRWWRGPAQTPGEP
ncbi:MAG: sulfatase, partial [Luteolibacter sp.]